jgi:hypothetical protein
VFTGAVSARFAVQCCGIVVASLMSAGCAHRYLPTIDHPMSHAARPKEAALDCEQLDLAILKVDTVRWVIRDDGGTLETGGERASRYAANALLIPLSMSVGLALGYIPEQGSAVLDAADRRILGLLRLKRDHGCPPRETTELGMTDLQMLEALEPLMPEKGELDRQTFDRRTSLLDRLRPPVSAP